MNIAYQTNKTVTPIRSQFLTYYHTPDYSSSFDKTRPYSTDLQISVYRAVWSAKREPPLEGRWVKIY